MAGAECYERHGLMSVRLASYVLFIIDLLGVMLLPHSTVLRMYRDVMASSSLPVGPCS